MCQRIEMKASLLLLLILMLEKQNRNPRLFSFHRHHTILLDTKVCFQKKVYNTQSYFEAEATSFSHLVLLREDEAKISRVLCVLYYISAVTPVLNWVNKNRPRLKGLLTNADVANTTRSQTTLFLIERREKHKNHVIYFIICCFFNSLKLAFQNRVYHIKHAVVIHFCDSFMYFRSCCKRPSLWV